jgi:hypothetical protein
MIYENNRTKKNSTVLFIYCLFIFFYFVGKKWEKDSRGNLEKL